MNGRLERRYTSSTTISRNTLRGRGHIIADTAGIVLTLPTPVHSLRGRVLKVTNSTDGWVTLFCSGGFLNSNDAVVIDPWGQVDIGVQAVGASTYEWGWSGDGYGVISSTWTPTAAWTTGTPASESISAKYWLVSDMVFFCISSSSADGNGGTAVTYTLPTNLLPQNTGCDIPVACSSTVDGTVTVVKGAFIDTNQAVVESRKVTTTAARGFPAWTDTKTCSLVISGWYPVNLDGWTAWTPFASGNCTWGTGDPANYTEAGYYKVVGNKCYGIWSVTSADPDNAADSLTIAPPHVLPDRNNYAAARMAELQNATWYDNLPSIDYANNAGASRILSLNVFDAAVDAEALEFHLAAVWEVYTGREPWQSFTPTLTWTGTAPASVTAVGYYTVQEGLCTLHAYWTSADGNGATNCSMALPVLPVTTSVTLDCPADSYSIVNATESNVGARVDVSAGTLVFDAFDTWDDAQTSKIYVTATYPVA